MSIIRETIQVSTPSTPATHHIDTTPVCNLDWFSPLFLSSINHHPMDDTIQHTLHRTFFVRWFEQESDGCHADTISVTALLARDTDEQKALCGVSAVHDQRRETGIRLHYWIEAILNGFPMETDDVLYRQAHSYYKDRLQGTLVPWRTEMAIRSASDIRLVGVVDALFFDPRCVGKDGILFLHMKDWKYSSGVSAHYMRDYTLQMNMYKYILETQYTGGDSFCVDGCIYTGVSIVSMDLVMFHETSTSYAVLSVVNEQETVKQKLQERKKRLVTIK